MICDNGYFKVTDENSLFVGNGKQKIDSSWWSRKYEYPWAYRQIMQDAIVADLGCGWWERPLKHALAEYAANVLCFDHHPNVLDLKNTKNVKHYVGDFVYGLDVAFESFFDQVYCISVLEDRKDAEATEKALKEIARILGPFGEAIITFDTPHDKSKPTPVYPGLSLGEFERAMKAAQLQYREDVDYSTDNLVNQPDWNLCVFHCVIGAA